MAPSRLFPVALLLACCLPAAAQQFVKAPSALPPQGLWTEGVALADVDADGDTDVLFANGQGYGGGGQLAQHLFLNDGAGAFTAAHGRLGVAPINAKMVLATDLDGDGDPDLMYAVEGNAANPDQRPRILINDGSGVFTDETSTRLPAVFLASFGVAAGDVDNDGDTDVVLTDGATFFGLPSQARLFLNDGSGHFSDATASHLPADLYNAQDVTLFDYDGDLDVDIALSGKGQQGKRARLYLNDGSGHFVVSAILDRLGTGNTYEIDWGDLDGDGNPDAAVQSVSGFQEGWARNQGPASQPAKSTFPAPNGDDDNEMALMDYDDDGDLDVFVGSLGLTEKVYTNQGGGVFARDAAAIQASLDSTLDLGFADLDGDGDHDMVTAQGEGGNFTNHVYFNQGPADSTPPLFVRVEQPTALGSRETVFRVQLQDSLSDDGEGNLGVSCVWSRSGGGGATGTLQATHQGGGLFRVAVPVVPGASSVRVEWTATDHAGNTASAGPLFAGDGPWFDAGFGLPGAAGEPRLDGSGALTPGSAGSLDLTQAAPSAVCLLFVSLGSTPVPFKGGTLAAFPVLVQVPLVTLPGGALVLPFVWPAGVPPGTELHFQYAIQDAGAIVGVALSNALRAVTP